MESSGQKKLLLINGASLNLLGPCEPQVYGSMSLTQTTSAIRAQADAIKIRPRDFSSNHEGAIIDRGHQSRRRQGVRHHNQSLRLHTYLHDDLRCIGSIPTSQGNLTDEAEAIVCGLGVYGYVTDRE